MKIRSVSSFKFLPFIITLLLISFSCDKFFSKADSNNRRGVGGVLGRFTAQRGEIILAGEWDGEVKYSDRKEITAERKIKIKNILVNNFSIVKKGQKIIEVDNFLDEKEYQSLLDKSQIEKMEMDSFMLKFNQLAKDVQVKKMLADKEIIPNKDYELILNEYRTSTTELKRKQIAMKKSAEDLAEAKIKASTTEIIADNYGIISSLVVKKSTNTEVDVGQRLAIIADPKRLIFECIIEDSYIGKLSSGMEATVTLDAIPQPLAAKIVFIDNHSDSDLQDWENPPSIGTNTPLIKKYLVKFAFNAQDSKVREFYRGRVKIIFNKKSNVITVPLIVLKSISNEIFITVINAGSNTPMLRKITTGIQNDSEIEVVSGLKEGEIVLASGGES
ncbi:MAG: HlyD family efflux transporter periplasmic adaptor subunit [Oligoflexia bacterium]|nr:HlyD family efflux transporter periplasmic adaptor subunit [Oligoflexia bacterium]